MVQICEMMLFLNSGPVFLCSVKRQSYIHSLVAHLLLGMQWLKIFIFLVNSFRFLNEVVVNEVEVNEINSFILLIINKIKGFLC